MKNLPYYKLTDGRLIPFTGQYIKENGRTVAPPTRAALARAGYYPLLYEPTPAYDEATERLHTEYVLEDGCIRAEHTVMKKAVMA